MTDLGSITRADLIARIADAERSFTERKLEGAMPEELRKPIVAFANSASPDQNAFSSNRPFDERA